MTVTVRRPVFRLPDPPQAPPVERRIDVRPLFRLMVDRKGSDLFFTVNAPVKIKIEGEIHAINEEPLSVAAVEQIAFGMMTDAQAETYRRHGEVEYAVSESGLGRFRVTVFSQRGTPAIVLRYVHSEVPRLEQLGLPVVLSEIAMLPRGLVLVTGANGVGKSTTLAAMINHRNEKRSDHILTVEDPIEFIHTNQLSIVNQREVGADVASFHLALRGAMRAAPDVVVIGEIRDRETMEAALFLAGTGHLCLASLHANNSAEAIERIVNLFPREHGSQVLLDLSQYLRAVVSQRLVRGVDKHRVAAVEVLTNTSFVQELIKKGDISAVKEAIRASAEQGMQSFDNALSALIKQKKITLEEALMHADSRANLEARVHFG
jgi:twitching motility protein PilU